MSDNNQNFLQTVENNLTVTLAQKASALPKDFNQTRFLQNCFTVLAEIKDLSKIAPVSIVKTLMKGAFLGLDFFDRECYAIPYGTELNFQTDYNGEIKLAKMYSVQPISDIYAMLVKEGDFYEVKVVDGKKIVKFEPKIFNDGKIIGAFAIVNYTDGTMGHEDMSLKDMDTVKTNYCKAANSPAWKNSPGEMYKKTVLRRLLKGIQRKFDSAEQSKAYQESSDFEFDKTQQPQPVKNVLAAPAQEPVKEKIIEAEVVKPKAEEKAQQTETLDHMCSNCCVGISAKVKEFSSSKYGRPLCMDCQEQAEAGLL